MDEMEPMAGIDLMALAAMLKAGLSQNGTGSETKEESNTYDCPECRDTGLIAFKDEEGRWTAKQCKCWPAQRAKRLLKESGLEDAVSRQTFDSFQTNTLLQEKIKQKAEEYLRALLAMKGKKESRRPWFYVGGNPGSGKTHICTAICGKLLDDGIDVKYMQWVNEARRLKFINDPEEYDNAVNEYVRPSVLYIDDLLKQKYVDHPTFTEGDIKIAFSVLNQRYLLDKPTIISSEWDLLDQLMDADEGVFSRVYERSKGFTLIVDRKQENNFRITGAV